MFWMDQLLIGPTGPSGDAGAAGAQGVTGPSGPGGTPTTHNKDMAAANAPSAGDLMCATGLYAAPIGYVQVAVQGGGTPYVVWSVGDGVTTSSCYWSRAAAPYSNGAQALAMSQLTTGDQLYMGSGSAAYPVAAIGYLVSFFYNVAP